MRVRKDLLKPGRYVLADGREVVYTPADVAHLARRLREMTAAGIAVPVAWEHAEQAKPMSDEERRIHRSKWNAGWADDAWLSDDGVDVWLDIPNEDDAKRLPSVGYVSAEIVENWRDGTGRVWPGKSISHIALTPRPVHHHQQRFSGPSGSGRAAAMSHGAVWLSLNDLEDKAMNYDFDFKQLVSRLKAALKERARVNLDASGVGKDNYRALCEAVLDALGTGDQETSEQFSLSAGAWSVPARQPTRDEVDQQVRDFDRLVYGD